MSAWKPTVCGRPTCSSSSTLRFTLCMPPQQISPSAARRSPKDSATSAASRNVSAIFLVLPAGSLAHSAGLGGRVDADDAVLADADVLQLLADRAGLAHLGDEGLALLLAAHRRPATGRRPHRRNQRADDEVAPADAVGQLLQVVIRRIDADVRIEEEEIDAVELDAVHFRLRGVVQHRLEIDGRLGAGSALADETGPHRVMDSRVFVHRLAGVWLFSERLSLLLLLRAGPHPRSSLGPHPHAKTGLRPVAAEGPGRSAAGRRHDLRAGGAVSAWGWGPKRTKNADTALRTTRSVWLLLLRQQPLRIRIPRAEVLEDRPADPTR